jgi:uncharacterized protein (DUF1330 family)
LFKAASGELKWQRDIGSSCIHSISDPAALATYGKLARQAVVAHGGRFLTRGEAVKAYEQGIAQRTTMTEFDSVE